MSEVHCFLVNRTKKWIRGEVHIALVTNSNFDSGSRVAITWNKTSWLQTNKAAIKLWLHWIVSALLQSTSQLGWLGEFSQKSIKGTKVVSYQKNWNVNANKKTFHCNDVKQIYYHFNLLRLANIYKNDFTIPRLFAIQRIIWSHSQTISRTPILKVWAQPD